MNKNFILTVLAIIMFGSCNPSREPVLKAQTSILQASSYTSFGVYFSGSDSVKVEAFIELIKRKLPGFERMEEVPDTVLHDTFILDRYDQLTDETAAPDVEYLRFSAEGLSEDEMLMLQNCKRGWMLLFLGTSENAVIKQRNITSFMAEIFTGKNTFIGDFTTRRYYSTTSWKVQRANEFTDKAMFREITLHTYRDGEFCRMVSLGMEKFCLPDISVNDISCMDQESLATLVNAIIATWVNNPNINTDSTLLIDLPSLSTVDVKGYLISDLKEGAEQRAELKLRYVEPQEGDNPTAQFMIVFNDSQYATPQEEQSALLKKIFGSKDSVTGITHDDAILEASARAQEKLPELQAFFNKGLEPGYSLLLKAPFETDSGGNEWMWVEVTIWKDDSIEGILQNEPSNVSDLKAGAKVIVSQQDVFDYILYKPDGTLEGNETGKLIESMQ